MMDPSRSLLWHLLSAGSQWKFTKNVAAVDHQTNVQTFSRRNSLENVAHIHKSFV